MPRDLSTSLRSTRSDLTAVLLAGGESRRMGRDKATALFRGKPLWEIQLGLLRKLEPSQLFISARSDPRWRPADVEFIPDEPPSRGPLSGLAASIAKLRTTHLLALAVDTPLMSESFLRSLCDSVDPGCGVVPIIQKRPEPLAAIYPREAEIDFRNALAGENFSLQSLVWRLVATGKVRELIVEEQERKFFTNLNSCSDFAAL